MIMQKEIGMIAFSNLRIPPFLYPVLMFYTGFLEFFWLPRDFTILFVVMMRALLIYDPDQRKTNPKIPDFGKNFEFSTFN